MWRRDLATRDVYAKIYILIEPRDLVTRSTFRNNCIFIDPHEYEYIPRVSCIRLLMLI